MLLGRNGDPSRELDALQADAVLVRPDFNVFGAGNAPALVESLMAAWKSMPIAGVHANE